MTNRSRGVLKTRCNAIVSSTTPRFGPRCPPVCERILINSSRTSCASWDRSCSRRPLISAGERIPSSRRLGAGAVWADSEELDFVICASGLVGHGGRSLRLLRRLELFNYGFACAVAGNDFDLLLGLGKPFLANFYEVHSFFVTHDQILERQFTRLHLLDDFFEAIHCAFKIKFWLTRLRFAAHGENEELSTG